MTRRCIIVGAGGLGREVAGLARAAGVEVVGFLDDADPDDLAARPGTLDAPLLGTIASGATRGLPVLLGVGMPAVRTAVDAALRAAGRLTAPAVVHPTAVVGPHVRLGEGTVVAAGSILTTDVEVARQVLVNLACTIGHDVTIGPLTAVMPGVNLSGGARIGARVLVGTGATVLEGVTVGDDARIGAGAVVVRDVAPGTTVVGVPARPLGA